MNRRSERLLASSLVSEWGDSSGGHSDAPDDESHVNVISITNPRRRRKKPRWARNWPKREKGRFKIGPKAIWCERGDSNPHGFTRQILSLVRLPIPPLSHFSSTYFQSRCEPAPMATG